MKRLRRWFCGRFHREAWATHRARYGVFAQCQACRERWVLA